VTDAIVNKYLNRDNYHIVLSCRHR